MNRLRSSILSLMLCGQLAGCHQPAENITRPPAQPIPSVAATSTQPPPLMSMRAIPSEDPRDPQPALQAMVQLDIYYLDLPPKSVSDNKAFWKRVDEEAVGVGTRDLMEKNGIRTGIAPRTEAGFFGSFFEKLPHPPARRSRVDGLHSETVAMQIEQAFDAEDLFVYLKGEKQPVGKSYEHGTNSLMLTFGPTPRDPSAVRVTICPAVHSQRRHMQFTSLNQEHETIDDETDRIYDMNLTVDVPEDSFLVIAPGVDSARSTSVGGCFLIKPGTTQRREQVILIVPNFLRLDGKPMNVRGPLVK